MTSRIPAPNTPSDNGGQNNGGQSKSTGRNGADTARKDTARKDTAWKMTSTRSTQPVEPSQPAQPVQPAQPAEKPTTPNPVAKELKTLGKYAGVSGTQTIVEYGVFTILHLFLASQIANGVAIVCSATYNFLMNRNITFKSSSSFTRSVVLFVTLWIWNFAFSTVMLGWLPGAFGVPPMAVKFACMVMQGLWGYPLCHFVIFR